MVQGIKLGYEIGTGVQVDIPLSHLIVTGITQLSGKTTTLEALIKRSGLRAVVFKTKIGERSFAEGVGTPPYFKDRSDYEFVRSLIEAYSKEKLFLERGTLMKLCKGSGSLVEIKRRVDEALANPKLRGLSEEIHTRLQHYLENLIPQIQNANLSKTLLLREGVNVMNLERFSEEAQSLIIQSVLDEVLRTFRDVIIVVPEAWKFVPQRYNNPCKRSVESFIRQGAANGNFVWIDSQDMSGVDKTVLKQVSTWVLGYQAERNEVKHTLDQISLPKILKPHEQEIMTLKRGQFILSSYDGVKKVYVQPAWLSDEQAIAVARGEQKVESVQAPEVKKSNGDDDMYDDTEIRNEVRNLRVEVLHKIEELSSRLNRSPGASVDVNRIVDLVLSKIPKTGGIQVYQVAPLEKIRKDFQEEAKNHILGEIAKLDDEHKKILKFVEVQGKGCNQTQIIDKCLYQSATSGGNRDKVSKKTTAMSGLKVVRKDKNAVVHPNLKEFIREYAATHGITEPEIQQVYDHILASLI